LAASAAAAGALVGRFGRRAGKNHAAAGGAATAMFGGALAWSQAAPGAALHLWLATWVLLGAIAAGGAYLGFWLTRPRARP
jgi:tRNA-(ms[2]io[6]A)-hydroxylase